MTEQSNVSGIRSRKGSKVRLKQKEQVTWVSFSAAGLEQKNSVSCPLELLLMVPYGLLVPKLCSNSLRFSCKYIPETHLSLIPTVTITINHHHLMYPAMFFLLTKGALTHRTPRCLSCELLKRHAGSIWTVSVVGLD